MYCASNAFRLCPMTKRFCALRNSLTSHAQTTLCHSLGIAGVVAACTWCEFEYRQLFQSAQNSPNLNPAGLPIEGSGRQFTDIQSKHIWLKPANFGQNGPNLVEINQSRLNSIKVGRNLADTGQIRPNSAKVDRNRLRSGRSQPNLVDIGRIWSKSGKVGRNKPTWVEFCQIWSNSDEFGRKLCSKPATSEKQSGPNLVAIG